MAAANAVDPAHYLALCRFRELFSGRFTDEDAVLLLQKFDWDEDATIKFVFSSEPGEVRREIDNENESWTTVMGKVNRLKKSDDAATGAVLQRARTQRIDTSARLFACAPCDSYWWKRISERKKVSCCHRCRVRYDAIPREFEWGKAVFHCPGCQKEFIGFCSMQSFSPCYDCGLSVKPSQIIPYKKEARQRQSSNIHCCSCCAEWRHGRGSGTMEGRGRDFWAYDVTPGHRRPPSVTTCVHPQTRRLLGLPMVVEPSALHDSTGSTVNTFLPQDDLMQAYESVRKLEDIAE